jgi:hypothetical protein
VAMAFAAGRLSAASAESVIWIVSRVYMWDRGVNNWLTDDDIRIGALLL